VADVGYKHQKIGQRQSLKSGRVLRKVQKDLPIPPEFWAHPSVPAGPLADTRYNQPAITSPHDSQYQRQFSCLQFSDYEPAWIIAQYSTIHIDLICL
jgi:hypothetical protein